MTIEEACKNFVPKDEIPKADETLIDAAEKLISKIWRYKSNNPDFKYLRIEDEFINYLHINDLSLNCTIKSVDDIYNDSIDFKAEESWAYGGYAEGCINIPIKYLNISDEELDKICKNYAKNYYKKQIDNTKSQIERKQEELAEYEEIYNKYK